MQADGEAIAAEPVEEVRAWLIMGANVFLGLRFGVWGREDPKEIARIANRMLAEGIADPQS